MDSTRTCGQRVRSTPLRRRAHESTMSWPPTSVLTLHRRWACSDSLRSAGDRSGRRRVFVRSGNPEFVFHDGHGEVRIATAPGDYVFVPPFVPQPDDPGGRAD
jgi:hypothetical protein